MFFWYLSPSCLYVFSLSLCPLCWPASSLSLSPSTKIRFSQSFLIKLSSIIYLLLKLFPMRKGKDMDPRGMDSNFFLFFKRHKLSTSSWNHSFHQKPDGRNPYQDCEDQRGLEYKKNLNIHLVQEPLETWSVMACLNLNTVGFPHDAVPKLSDRALL